jgi:hypothetical protein
MAEALIILLNDDINHELLVRLLSTNPHLKQGFTLEELMQSPSIPQYVKKTLETLFANKHSTVITSEYIFEYKGDKWDVKQIDVQRTFHQVVTRVLNHAAKESKYPIGSVLSTKDTNFLTFLMKKRNETYKKITKQSDDEGLSIDQELLEFLSNGLSKRLGESAGFDYDFVVAFIETLRDYGQIMIRKYY